MHQDNKNKRINITPLVFLGVGLILIFIGFILTRLYFFGVHSDYFVAETSDNILLALLHGLRFDLATIALLNSLLLLFLFVSIWFRALFKANMVLVFVYLFFVSVSAIIINFMDTVYFPYTGRRSGLEVLSMANDVVSQLPELILVYWWYVVGSILIYFLYAVLFFKVSKRLKPIFMPKFWVVLLCLVLTVVFVLAGRGRISI